jgi:light-regulated signal transduction histidine kinase (bacteriophytochrome)
MMDFCSTALLAFIAIGSFLTGLIAAFIFRYFFSGGKKTDPLYIKALEESNRELEDFAYIVSHDLKEPLRGLHNFSHFLVEDYGSALDEKGRKMLATMGDLTKHMEEQLNSLVHYSRLGRTKLSVRPTDLNEIARNAISLHAVMM